MNKEQRDAVQALVELAEAMGNDSLARKGRALLSDAAPQEPQEPQGNGWVWMTHPSRNEGRPIPVWTEVTDGVRWYVPFDTEATDFEWDERDEHWRVIEIPMWNAEMINKVHLLAAELDAAPAAQPATPDAGYVALSDEDYDAIEAKFPHGWSHFDLGRAVEREVLSRVQAVRKPLKTEEVHLTAPGNPWEVKVHCSRGERTLRAGMQWRDWSGGVWEVVEPTDGRIYSPSGLGGTPTFWCKLIGEPNALARTWLEDARGDGCVSFCGDSIAAALIDAVGAVEAPSSANQQISPESSAALATQGVQLWEGGR